MLADKRGKWDVRVPAHSKNAIYVRPPDEDTYLAVPLRDTGGDDFSSFEHKRATESLRRKMALKKGERLNVTTEQIRLEVEQMRLELVNNANRSKTDARYLELNNEQAARREKAEVASVEPAAPVTDIPVRKPSRGINTFRVRSKNKND